MEDEIVNCVNGIRYVHRPYLKKSAYDEKEGVVYLTTEDFEDLNRSINPDSISKRFKVSGNNIMDGEDKYGQYSRLYDFGDVDFSEREIIVFGKGAKQRIVYFDDRTNLFLQKYLETREDDNPALFVHQKRTRNEYLRLDKSGLGTRVRMWGRACGIEDVHPHRFRRTMATRALRAGMPIEQIQVILGHSSIETTRIYAKVNQDDVKYAHRKYVR